MVRSLATMATLFFCWPSYQASAVGVPSVNLANSVARVTKVRNWLMTIPDRFGRGGLTGASRPVGSRSPTIEAWLKDGQGLPDVERSLLILLQTERDGRIRSDVVFALGLKGSENSVRPLITVLKTDQYSFVRFEAAAALGNLHAKEALEPLCEAMMSKDANVRANACEALGKLKDQRALDGIRKALDDEDPLVRFVAREVLNEWKK